MRAKQITIIRILEKLRQVNNGRFVIDVVQVLYNIIERQRKLMVNSHLLEICLITIYLTNFSHHENE